MILHPRGEVWPGQTPTNSTGTVRPKLKTNRPIYTVHYTGGGLWLDEDDTPAELRSIQRYAFGAKKPWEYNYVIDGQGHVWEYAGLYQAAHSEGENHLAISVLMLVGLKDAAKLTGFERPTDAMIQAVRELRHYLVSISALADDHSMLQHREMPGANTICPGPEVRVRWTELTTPWVPPIPPDPDPTPDPEPAPDPRPPQESLMYVFYVVQSPPAVFGGFSFGPKYPAIQLEWLETNERIDAIRQQGAIDYPGGPIASASALGAVTLIGALPPGYTGREFSRVVA